MRPPRRLLPELSNLLQATFAPKALLRAEAPIYQLCSSRSSNLPSTVFRRWRNPFDLAPFFFYPLRLWLGFGCGSGETLGFSLSACRSSSFSCLLSFLFSLILTSSFPPSALFIWLLGMSLRLWLSLHWPLLWRLLRFSVIGLWTMENDVPLQVTSWLLTLFLLCILILHLLLLWRVLMSLYAQVLFVNLVNRNFRYNSDKELHDSDGKAISTFGRDSCTFCTIIVRLVQSWYGCHYLWLWDIKKKLFFVNW